jgi:hypothetical protein
LQIIQSVDNLLDSKEKTEVAERIKELQKYENTFLFQNLILAMEHGVGVHHAGCCKKYFFLF